MDPVWAVGALGHWARILGPRSLGAVTCILGPGRGSLLGRVTPFLWHLSQAPADGGRGVAWVGSGWGCLAALFWARLAGRAWPRPTDCVSGGGLMFMGSGPLAQRVSLPPARLEPSLWLRPQQVAQERLSQVGLGVAAPSSQSWAPAQAPKDGSPLFLMDRLLGLLLPLLLPPSRRPLRFCPTPLSLHLSWELSLDLCLWAPGTPWWDTWWSREESPKAV